MVGFDMRGLTPAPVTPFTEDGAVDYEALQRLGSWLGGIDGVKGLVVLGHAGEGTFLTVEEQVSVIKAFVKSVENKVPIIAGITGEGTEVAALEAKRAKEAGAAAGLLYPSHGWLRFGYQPGAPQDRYRRVYEVSGLPLILFQYPDNTKATYSLQTMLDIAAQPGCFAMKNGVRNMRRWDTEIPVIRAHRPDLQILSCHDEYLLHTSFDIDGLLVGYGNIAPEPLIELIKAGKATDYKKARAIHDQLLPVTKSVYHRGSHMEGTVALKHALVARGILTHATVRPPLLPLEAGAEQEIHAAINAASLNESWTRRFSATLPTVSASPHPPFWYLNPTFPSTSFHIMQTQATMAPLPPPQTSPAAPQSSRALSGKRPLSTTNADADEENRRKDPKISRACDTCKRKKIRCDGILPCSNCAKRKLNCAYDAKYGRGRPPTPPPSTSVNERQERSRSDYSNDLSIWKQQAPVSHDMSTSQVHSRASPEIEIEGQYFDPTSGLNFLHRAWKKLLTQKDESTSYDSSDTERNQLLTSAGDRPFHVDNSASDAFIPDGSTARKLHEFYFETCVVTYRMFHRQTVEDWMELFLKDRQLQRPMAQSLGNSRTAILLTIMAIATLRFEKVHGEMSTEDESLVLQRSDHLFCAGMRLTEMEMGFPRLESAQARLIQVLYLLQTARMNKGWYTFGNAFHITLSLGMHRRRGQKRDFPFTSKRQNYITSECYKRTFWAAYIIDKYLSVVFGRPRLYQDDDIDQNFPDNVNDEDMTPHGPSIPDDPADCYIDALIFHAKIARIIGKVSREVYSVSDLSNEDRLAAAHRSSLELHEWHASLPSHLGTVKPSTLIPSFRRQAIALQLAYSHALIHTNRPFLLTEGGSENVTECISATKASLELVNRMAGDNTLLHSFWWTHYVIFCALAVVYVWEIQGTTRPTDEIDNQSLGKIFDLAEKCHGHLKRASTGLSQNQRYTIILDELRSEARRCRILRGNPPHPQQSGRPGGETNANTEIGFPSLQDPDMFGSTVGVQEELMPNMLDSFLFSDWQTLDSSAIFPFPDPDSVSPTFPAVL
ncbi:unnamed protein product [Penicillium nalgiovense]|nr:unnamed protein product [Penicillium nalgiovense]